jgi:hypothetical protein
MPTAEDHETEARLPVESTAAHRNLHPGRTYCLDACEFEDQQLRIERQAGGTRVRAQPSKRNY